MTDQDKNYIESHTLWLRSNELNREEWMHQFQSNKRTISILEQQNQLYEAQILSSQEYSYSAQKDFEEWKVINAIK